MKAIEAPPLERPKLAALYRVDHSFPGRLEAAIARGQGH
jgi:hypothetical protein